MGTYFSNVVGPLCDACSLDITQHYNLAYVFNATVFEDTLASGEHPFQTRDEALPTSRLPQCLEYLFNSDLTPPLYEAPHIMTTVMSEATHRF
jgi:hypothetical protein